MAQLTNAQLLTKYNDSSTGLFKDQTNREIVPNRPRSLVTDLTDSFFNKTDDAYTSAFPSTNVAGTDTYTANLIPAITAYASGQKVQLVFANPNTGPATINLNGLGAKAITKNGDSPISAGDITAGQALFLYYDGTQFQIQGGGGGGGGGASDWGDLGGTITDQTDLVDYIDDQIEGAISGLKWKNPVRIATNIAGTLATSFENGDTVDGVVVATGDRILLKNQADQTTNGIYTVNASGAPTRATDSDTATELEGATVSVLEGTANANTTWVQTTDGITLGGSNIIFAQFGSSVSDADASTKGIAKLYPSTSLGTNTDGAPDQNAVKVYADTKAPLASPTFTGTPAAPTASVGTNTTQVATTAYVQSEKLLVHNRQTGSYTLVLGDAHKIVEMNVASANNLTIPLNATVAYPVGTSITLVQYGAGTTSVVATGGVTIRSSSGLLTAPGQYAPMVIEKVGTDEWYLWNGAASQIAWGTYTPTLFNIANLAASTAYTCNYLRVGNSVTVSGKVDIDPTSTGNTQLGISFPIASAITAAEQCGGVAAATGIAGQSAAITGDATNDRAELQYVAVDVTNKAMFFIFTYTLL